MSNGENPGKSISRRGLPSGGEIALGLGAAETVGVGALRLPAGTARADGSSSKPGVMV